MDEQRRESEERARQPGDAGQEPSVTAELQELGRTLIATARAAWQSERRQGLQEELADGLRSLRDQLTEAIETVKTDPRARNVTETVKEQVGKVAEGTRVSGPVDDLRSGVARGVRDLNEQLRRLTEQLARQRDGMDAAPSDAARNPAAPVVTNTTDAIQAAPPVTAAPPADAVTQNLGTGLATQEPALTPEPAGTDTALPEVPEGGSSRGV